MVVDINDFPSFGNVPEAEKLVARCVIETAQRMEQPFPYDATPLAPKITHKLPAILLTAPPIQKDCSLPPSSMPSSMLPSTLSPQEEYIVNR
jgi:hypothetical protein